MVDTSEKEEKLDTESSPARLRRDEISKCQKSQLTQLVNKMKVDSEAMRHRTRVAQQAEQLAERQKMFKGVSDAQPDPTVQ